MCTCARIQAAGGRQQRHWHGGGAAVSPPAAARQPVCRRGGRPRPCIACAPSSYTLCRASRPISPAVCESAPQPLCWCYDPTVYTLNNIIRRPSRCVPCACRELGGQRGALELPQAGVGPAAAAQAQHHRGERLVPLQYWPCTCSRMTCGHSAGPMHTSCYSGHPVVVN